MIRIAEKGILYVLFEIEMSSEKDAPTNSQVTSYGKVDNNPYLNMAPPLAWQSYVEMLNKIFYLLPVI